MREKKSSQSRRTINACVRFRITKRNLKFSFDALNNAQSSEGEKSGFLYENFRARIVSVAFVGGIDVPKFRR